MPRNEAGLEEILSDFELSLNPNKITVIDLPTHFDNPWASELRIFSIREDPRGQRSDLIRFFERGFELGRSYPGASTLKFCVSRLFRETIQGENLDLVHNMILQCMLVEPGVVANALQLLHKPRRDGRPIPSDRLRSALNVLIKQHSHVLHGREVAWALWGHILFGLQVPASSVRLIERASDPFIALIALDAETRGLVEEPINKDVWASSMGVADLRDELWLLSYEAGVRGWLPFPGGADHIAANDAFAYLRENNVHFYRVEGPDILTEQHTASLPRDLLVPVDYP